MNSRKTFFKSLSRSAIAFIIGFVTLVLIPIQLSHAQALNFTGRYIATLADGDFLASTYSNRTYALTGVLEVW